MYYSTSSYLLPCSFGSCLRLQEGGEQQAYKDLSQRRAVWFLRASDLPVCSGAHQSLPPRVTGPVQRQVGHKTSVSHLQIPAGG